MMALSQIVALLVVYSLLMTFVAGYALGKLGGRR